jgi:hypothetical protein
MCLIFKDWFCVACILILTQAMSPVVETLISLSQCPLANVGANHSSGAPISSLSIALRVFNGCTT